MYYHFGSVHFIVEHSLVGSEHILVHFCPTVYREPQISVLREFRIKKKTCFSYVTIFSEIADFTTICFFYSRLSSSKTPVGHVAQHILKHHTGLLCNKNSLPAVH